MISKPLKISGIKDLIHKYNNFFFDLDGVIVIFFFFYLVGWRLSNSILN
jgi:hypothetical protein